MTNSKESGQIYRVDADHRCGLQGGRFVTPAGMNIGCRTGQKKLELWKPMVSIVAGRASKQLLLYSQQPQFGEFDPERF